MKKILFALAAVAALAACSKSEVEYTQTGEIGLVPVTQNITKAMVETTTFPTENFSLWAYYKPLAAGTTIADWQDNTDVQQEYIKNKEFTSQGKSSGKWGGVVPYFWPKVGSLMFVGYYPSSADVSYLFDGTNNVMTISDYTPGMVSEVTTHTEDLMYFNMTPASYSGNDVPVTFRHALSWITVILVKSSETPDAATIKVNSVAFTGVEPTGTGTVNNSPDTEAVPAETNEITWETSGTAATGGVVVTEAEGHVIEKTNTTPLVKQPLFIPQTMDGNLVVNYTISSTDNSSFTENKIIPLNTMKSGETTLSKWEPAKHYIYTITIGTEEILVAPQVEGWSPVPVAVPIQ